MSASPSPCLWLAEANYMSYKMLAYCSGRHWLTVHDDIGLWFMTLLGMTFVPCFCSPLPSRMHVYRKLFDSVVWVPPMEEAVSCDAYALGVT